MSDFVISPHKPIGECPPGYKGGPGKYDGEKIPGGQGRTPSPNAVPEKIIDIPPGSKTPSPE